MPGPAPKPVELHVLNGNPGHKTKAQLERNYPKPAPVAPKCPDWLDKDAKKEWARVAPELEKLGLIAKMDMAALAGYCQAYSEWKACTEAIREKGRTTTNAAGSPIARPEVAIANKA